MTDYVFDDVEEMKRDLEVEGKTGTVVDFPDAPDGTERWMRLLAATDANPRWKADQVKILAGWRRLVNAKAPAAKIRKYFAPIYARCLVIEWGGWRIQGAEIPLSVEACTALLLQADDAYDIIDDMVWKTQNFRGQRIEASVKKLGE